MRSRSKASPPPLPPSPPLTHPCAPRGPHPTPSEVRCPYPRPRRRRSPRNAGIGKSIASKLARQGINVVLVALGDPLLDATFEELKTEFPKQEFRKV
eukprot:350435-Chlamydomonas_euryale.AAC.6